MLMNYILLYIELIGKSILEIEGDMAPTPRTTTGGLLLLISPCRAHVSYSGPRAKFGRKCNHNWPARSYQICIRVGPQSIPHLFQMQFLMCLKYQYFVVQDSVFKQNHCLFPYEKVKHYIPVVVTFSISIESGP